MSAALSSSRHLGKPAIQLLGVSYKRRIKHVAPAAVAQVEEIIELA